MKKVKLIVSIFAIATVIVGAKVKIEAHDYLTYDGKEYSVENLSKETIEWIKWYNTLSPDEQEAISYIPPELK